jgi:zinc transport system permease protein
VSALIDLVSSPATTLAVAMPWPFEREYLQLALIAGVAVGACSPLIGAFLVQRRLSLMGDGLGHLAFAGVGLAVLVGTAPLWLAFIFAAIGALVVERIRVRSRESGDLALSLIFYSGLAAGSVLLGKSKGGTNASQYLFGALLTVSRSETLAVLLVGALIVTTLTLTGRAMFAVLLDEEASTVAGLPVRILNDVLMILTAVTVVAGMRTVGILLVSALMVLPVGAAKALTTSFRGLLLVASLLGASSAVLGLVFSRLFDLLPGGTIVLVTAVLFIVATLIGPMIRRRAG